MWKWIPGYENIYQVNECGEIYSFHSKRLLKPYIASDGYLRVNLSKNNKVKITMLHRIVAEVFIPNPNNLPVVNHIDGNKGNPNIGNLEWVTFSDNSYHAFAHGLSRISDRCKKAVSKIAAENGAKTTQKAVDRLSLSGEYIDSFKSIREAERITGISRANIGEVCRGRRRTAHGYIWKYSNH